MAQAAEFDLEWNTGTGVESASRAWKFLSFQRDIEIRELLEINRRHLALLERLGPSAAESA